MGTGLNLHPVGLNEEGRKILSVAMNILEVSGCRVCCTGQISQNTVALIDMDSEEGRHFYENSSETHLKVVIAGDNRSYRADGLIRKPLRVQALRNLLVDISEKMLHQTSPQVSNTIPATTSQLSNSRTLPNASLFYALVNAVSSCALYKIDCGDDSHPLLIHGPSRRLYTSLSWQELQKAASLQGEQLNVRQLNEFEFMKQAQGIASSRIDKVLWLASKYGSRGYSPLDMGEQGEFHLTDRPRFDVKYVKPEYLTLAAITSRKSHTFGSLARMTRIPLTTVFDFYHAARACGVVEHTAPTREPVQVQANVVPSLVSRVAQKLGLKFF